MKKIMLLVAMFALSLTAMAENKAKLPEVSNPPQLVNDFAGLMQKSDVESLEKELEDYDKAKNIQIAVVTVPNIEGWGSVEDFANDLFRKWGIGPKGTTYSNEDRDRGILILYTAKEKKWRIEVGYGLEYALTDGAAGDGGILGKRKPLIARYKAGETGALSQALVLIAHEVKNHLDTHAYPPGQKPKVEPSWFARHPILTILIIIVVLLIILWILNRLGIDISSSGSSYDSGSSWSSSSSSSGSGWGGFGGGSSGGGGASSSDD